MKSKLTDKTIIGLAPGDVWDEETRGLCLRVGVKRRTWYFVYRRGGPPTWLKLGTYPTLTLKAARVAARDQQGLIDKQKDPFTENLAAKAETDKAAAAARIEANASTFRAFVPEFIAFQKSRDKKTWKDDENKINRWMLKPWRDRPLKSITRSDCQEVLSSAQRAGLTVGVNRIQAVMTRLFTVALDLELIEHHPAVKIIKRAKEKAHNRVLTDAEIRTFWKRCTDQGSAASDVIKLRLVLGQRGGETLGMLVDELHDLDDQDAYWEMQGVRTKNGEAHLVALPPLARAIISAHVGKLDKTDTRVFPNTHKSNDDYRELSKIMTSAKPAYDWKDLRRTLSTRLAELGFSTEVIDRVTNHKRGGVTNQHYNKYRYLTEIRQALNAWDAGLTRILEGKPMIDSKVLPMKSRG